MCQNKLRNNLTPTLNLNCVVRLLSRGRQGKKLLFVNKLTVHVRCHLRASSLPASPSHLFNSTWISLKELCFLIVASILVMKCYRLFHREVAMYLMHMQWSLEPWVKHETIMRCLHPFWFPCHLAKTKNEINKETGELKLWCEYFNLLVPPWSNWSVVMLSIFLIEK